MLLPALVKTPSYCRIDWSAGVLIAQSECIDWLHKYLAACFFFFFFGASACRLCRLSVLVSCVAVILHIRSRTACHVVVLQLCVAAGCDRPPGVGLISRIKASIQIRGRKQRPSVCWKLHEHRTLPGAGWVCS